MSAALAYEQHVQALQGQFTALIGEFRILMSCLPLEDGKRQIPDTVAYEFQQAVIRLAFSALTDKDGSKTRSQQYRSAIRHFERAILDGWRLLLVQPGLHEQLMTNPALRKRLLDCHLNEYREAAGLASAPCEGSTAFIRDDIKEYRFLYMQLTGQESAPLDSGLAPGQDFNPAVFAILHVWGQYELILHTLLGKKDLGMLTLFMEAVLNGFSVESLQRCTDILASAILNTLVKLDPGFSQWLAASPAYHALLQRASEAMRQPVRDYAPLRVFFQKVVLPYYNIEVRDFTAPPPAKAVACPL